MWDVWTTEIILVDYCLAVRSRGCADWPERATLCWGKEFVCVASQPPVITTKMNGNGCKFCDNFRDGMVKVGEWLGWQKE